MSCSPKASLCKWENHRQKSNLGKPKGKALAENQEERQGKVSDLGQDSQIPGKNLGGSSKRELHLKRRKLLTLSVRKNEEFLLFETNARTMPIIDYSTSQFAIA